MWGQGWELGSWRCQALGDGQDSGKGDVVCGGRDVSAPGYQCEGAMAGQVCLRGMPCETRQAGEADMGSSI